jgi:hypothetical protein
MSRSIHGQFGRAQLDRQLSAARSVAARWWARAMRGLGAVLTAPPPEIDPLGWPLLVSAWMQRRPISDTEYRAIERAGDPTHPRPGSVEAAPAPQAGRRPRGRGLTAALLTVLLVTGVSAAGLSAGRADTPGTARILHPTHPVDPVHPLPIPPPTVPWFGNPALIRAGRI